MEGFLLNEDGSYLLLEDGGKLQLEGTIVVGWQIGQKVPSSE